MRIEPLAVALGAAPAGEISLRARLREGPAAGIVDALDGLVVLLLLQQPRVPLGAGRAILVGSARFAVDGMSGASQEQKTGKHRSRRRQAHCSIHPAANPHRGCYAAAQAVQTGLPTAAPTKNPEQSVLDFAAAVQPAALAGRCHAAGARRMECGMGLMSLGQIFEKYVPHVHSDVSRVERQHAADVERIARSLALQGGAPAEQWPLFVGPAETLIRFSRQWTNIC